MCRGGVKRLDLQITSTFASGATSRRAVTIHTDCGTITPPAARPRAGLTRIVAASWTAQAISAGLRGRLISVA